MAAGCGTAPGIHAYNKETIENTGGIMGYFNNRRNAEQIQRNIRPGSNHVTARRVEGSGSNVENLDEVVAIAGNTGSADAGKSSAEIVNAGRAGAGKIVNTGRANTGRGDTEKANAGRTNAGRTDTGKASTGRVNAGEADTHMEKLNNEKMACEKMAFENPLPGMLIDFSNPSDEMQTERDFRMLQSMYPDAAKELLPYIEEECDRMEYDGSAMFDEYPDYTTVYRVQKRIADAAREKAANEKTVNPSGENRNNASAAYGNDLDGTGTAFEEGWKNADAAPKEDLIRVMLLQEMHRRRARRRSYR
ncbi:MAG: hypothetical protein LUG99_05210 [Lachnospiraceae bacterium]|nr:hypothetical protein [Lachnospiraceae bacterium]